MFCAQVAAIPRGRHYRLRRRRGRARCDDSCAAALDGVCSDGSNLWRSPQSQEQVRVLCDLGTDCTDCAGAGARAGAAGLHRLAAASAASLNASNTLLLQERSVEVFAAWTRTQPAFLMPYTTGRADFDVSAHMERHRAVEPLYNVYWRRLTEACCADNGLVIDVGANFGYYSLYAASLGCRVIAWEPVPVFRAFLRIGVALNNLSHRVEVRESVVSDVAAQPVEMRVPDRGIWGTASVGGLNVDPAVKSNTYTVHSTTEVVDDVVHEQPCALKLDVEGYEPKVVAGMRRLLREAPPKAVLTEYSPGVAERARRLVDLREFAHSLEAFASAGYKMYHLRGVTKSGALKGNWSLLQLPPLDEITAATLAAERKNADNAAQDSRSGHEYSVPWDVHPRSLRAEFAHNTDLLLALDRSAIATAREVGIDAASDRFGLGGGDCHDTIRDGNPAEVIGRLCIDRNRTIAEAVAKAELPRPLTRQQRSRHQQVSRQARGWRLTGSPGQRGREMVRLADFEGGDMRRSGRRSLSQLNLLSELKVGQVLEG